MARCWCWPAPGTGKTRVLTTRLAHILATGRARPGQVLAVTFTNKAAREMIGRVERLIGRSAAGLWLGTFHAIAARILRRHAELAGLKPDFTILDTDDQIRLLKQIIQAADIDEKRWPARTLSIVIQRWKDRGLTVDKVAGADGADYANGRAPALYAAYQERLRTVNAVDFGDLLLHNLTLFTKHADVLADYQQRFRYLLVDEYQDTNVAQYLWLRLLAQTHHSICCVGDDDQSIYSLARRRGRQHPPLREGLPRRAASCSLEQQLPVHPGTSWARRRGSSPAMPGAARQDVVDRPRRGGPRSSACSESLGRRGGGACSSATTSRSAAPPQATRLGDVRNPRPRRASRRGKFEERSAYPRHRRTGSIGGLRFYEHQRGPRRHCLSSASWSRSPTTTSRSSAS